MRTILSSRTSSTGGTDALRPHDRAAAGDELRRPGRRSPSEPRRTGSRRCSGPTTTRASRARPASRRPTPGRSSPGWPARPSGSGSGRSSRRSRSGIPGNFAKVVTTVDEMSGGRIEVGVGAGWNELEHRQLGLDFPPIKERADLSRTSWRSCTGCGASRTAGRTTATGSRSARRASSPKPVDVPGRPRTPIGGARPRILVGGSGIAALVPARGALRGRVQPQLGTARRRRAEAYAALDDACAAIGRDPATLTRSAMAGVLVGRDQARGATAGRGGRSRRSAPRRPMATGSTERRDRWVNGTPDEARAAGSAVRRGGRRADHAAGLPALGPRHDRRDGRGADRPGLIGHGRQAVPARDLSRQPLRGCEVDAGRRGGSGPGSCPRARASRSVRSWSGVAVPISAATGAGEVGRLVDEEPAGRGQGRRRAAASRSAARIAARSNADDAGGRECRPGARRDARRGHAGPRGRGRAACPASGRRRGGRAGTSRGRGTRTAARTPPRP